MILDNYSCFSASSISSSLDNIKKRILIEIVYNNLSVNWEF